MIILRTAMVMFALEMRYDFVGIFFPASRSGLSRERKS